MTPRAPANVLAAFLQRVGQIRASRFERRQQAKDDSGKQRNAEREEEHGTINLNARRSQQLGRAQRDQKIRSLPREHQTQRASKQGQEQTLSQELSDDASTIGAQGGPESDLLLSGNTARQH